MKLKSDEELVQEVQEGNISAFEEFVRRYQGKLHSFVTYIMHDAQEAQDVVQDSFISLYKSIDRIDSSRKFSSYLFTMTRNQAISHLRRRKFHAPLEEAERLSHPESLETHALEEDEKHRIGEALDAIDNKYKKVISLYYFEDISYEEIAKRLKLPVNTIRTHLRRAKAALREAMK